MQNVGMSSLRNPLQDGAKHEEFNEAKAQHEKLFDANHGQVRDARA